MMFGLKIYQLKLSSFAFCFFILLSQLSIAQNNVENALKEAYKNKSIEALNQFIKTYTSETKYIEEAVRIRDQMAFDKAKEQNTVESYQEYIKVYPKAIQVQQAKQWIETNSKKAIEEIEENEYERVKKENTIESYTEFIIKYPNSKYHNYAKENIEAFQFDQNISTYSIEELIGFLTNYPFNPKHNYIYDTLKDQTLKYLSYEGLQYISKNKLYDIDFDKFLITFAKEYVVCGETKVFEKLYKDFPELKSNKKLLKKYQEAKAIESLLELEKIDQKTYNKNKQYFTSIKNDKSLQLIKKYIEPLISQKKHTNLNKALLPFEDDFRVNQFQQNIYQPQPPTPDKSKISYNNDSTIKLIVAKNPNGYGKTDIYISLKKGDSWQSPFILPKPINSIYREESPKINNEGDILYFYSDNGMTNNNLDLYLSFRGETWNDWSEPLKVSEIDFKNVKQNYKAGYVKDQDNNPMETLVYIEDEQTGQRHYTTKSSSISGRFAYPKQSRICNVISPNKGYLTRYYTEKEDLNLKQELIEDLFSKHKILIIETFFSEKTPDKLTTPAENYLSYIAKSIEGTPYILTISVHTQKGYKEMNEDDLSSLQATLIKERLISLGISFENVVAAGYGNKNPLIGWEGKNRIEIGFMKIGKVSE